MNSSTEKSYDTNCRLANLRIQRSTYLPKHFFHQPVISILQLLNHIFFLLIYSVFLRNLTIKEDIGFLVNFFHFQWVYGVFSAYFQVDPSSSRPLGRTPAFKCLIVIFGIQYLTRTRHLHGIFVIIFTICML